VEHVALELKSLANYFKKRYPHSGQNTKGVTSL